MATMPKKFKGFLSKAELAHLKDGLGTVVMFRRVREEHRETKAKTGRESCEVCFGIAKKLGWE